MARVMFMRKDDKALVKDLYEQYRKSCQVRNLSERTIKYYDDCIHEFLKFAGEGLELPQLTSELVEDYILYMKDKGLAATSINTYLRGIRTLVNWLAKRRYIEAFKVTLIKEEEVIKSTYNDAEIQLMLVKPDINKYDFTDYRNWVMVNMLLGTGIRLSTLISIRIGDLDLYNQLLSTRHNKNRKMQMIPLSKTLINILQEYLTYRNHKDDDEILFVTVYGTPYTPNGCYHAIMRHCHQRGIEHANVHKFRHTFAKNWIMSGGDVFRLQKILGHSSMEIVKKYVNIYGADLTKDFEKFNILDRFEKPKKAIKMR